MKTRTFEALKYPFGSVERKKLNKNPLTSEFARHLKVLVYKCDSDKIGFRPVKSVTNFEIGYDLINNPDKYKEKVKKYTPKDYNSGVLWSSIRKNKYKYLK